MVFAYLVLNDFKFVGVLLEARLRREPSDSGCGVLRGVVNPD